jgi:hypothetical protein
VSGKYTPVIIQIRPKTRLKGGMLCAVSEKRKENAPKTERDAKNNTTVLLCFKAAGLLVNGYTRAVNMSLHSVNTFDSGRASEFGLKPQL